MSVLIPLQRIPALIENSSVFKQKGFSNPIAAATKILESGGELDDGILRCVVEAASDESASVYEIGTSVLGYLAARFQPATDAVELMSRAKLAHVRHNAVLCLSNYIPEDMAIAILRVALTDRSARVRRKAADWSGRLRMHAIVPDLEAAASVERDNETHKVIRFEAAILKNGYFLHADTEGGNFITVDTGRSRFTRSIEKSALQGLTPEEVFARVRNLL